MEKDREVEVMEEVTEVEENKIKGFVKKHWKKALVGAGIGLAFIAGKCLGSKSSDDVYDLDELVDDTEAADGPLATE